jgi:tetratricopeptide (TPR) repeat protein
MVTLETYLGFLKIEENNFAKRINFFERNLDSIEQLPITEKTELEIYYIQALFDSGKYYHVLRSVDELIERVIIYNIELGREINPYKRLIFLKASSLYNTDQVDLAERIALELIRLEPDNSKSRILLEKCLHKRENKKTLNTKAICMFLFLLSAAIIAINLLVINHFYLQYKEITESIWKSLFLAASILLAWSYISTYYKIKRRIDNHIEDKKS